jgi:hypothetical protein
MSLCYMFDYILQRCLSLLGNALRGRQKCCSRSIRSRASADNNFVHDEGVPIRSAKEEPTLSTLVTGILSHMARMIQTGALSLFCAQRSCQRKAFTRPELEATSAAANRQVLGSPRLFCFLSIKNSQGVSLGPGASIRTHAQTSR